MRWARATNRVMKSRRAQPANSATRRTTVDANERFRSVVATIQPLLPNPQGAHDGGTPGPEPRVAGTRGTDAGPGVRSATATCRPAARQPPHGQLGHDLQPN